jgi:hypothetical protein
MMDPILAMKSELELIEKLSIYLCIFGTNTN